MGRDIGTYYVRVTLADGRGWIQEWNTHGRYTNGYHGWSPLTASRIPPTWDDEQDVLDGIAYMFGEGNYSCDCNKKLFLWYAGGKQGEEPESECGDTLEIASLVVIRPDASEIDLTSRLSE